MKSKIKAFIVVFTILTFSLFMFGCSNSDDEFRKTLERAQDKSVTGAPMTKQEKSVYDSFSKWKKENDAKKYNERNY